MKFNNFASFVRAQTKTDSTSFPNSELTLYSNIAKDLVAEEVVQEGEDFFDLVLNTDLVAGQREYSFPADMIKNMKMLEIKLDGTNWRRADEFDLNSYRLLQSSVNKPYNKLQGSRVMSGATTDEAAISANFSDETPLFDIDGNAIVIYTKTLPTAVSAGMKLHATIYPKDYIDADWSTTGDISVRADSISTALPRMTHEVLALKTIILYKQGNQVPLDQFDLNYPNEVRNLKMKIRRMNMDRTVSPNVPRDTGFNY